MYIKEVGIMDLPKTKYPSLLGDVWGTRIERNQENEMVSEGLSVILGVEGNNVVKMSFNGVVGVYGAIDRNAVVISALVQLGMGYSADEAVFSIYSNTDGYLALKHLPNTVDYGGIGSFSFNELYDEYRSRRDILRNSGLSYEEYLKLHSEVVMPFHIVVIDGVEDFKSYFGNSMNLLDFLLEGWYYGYSVVLVGDAPIPMHHSVVVSRGTDDGADEVSILSDGVHYQRVRFLPIDTDMERTVRSVYRLFCKAESCIW